MSRGPHTLLLGQASLSQVDLLVYACCAAVLCRLATLPLLLALLLRVLVEHKVGEILRITQLALHIKHD